MSGVRAPGSEPGNLALVGRELAIAWADGHESYFSFDELRRNCPCALCRSEAQKASREGPLRVVRAPAPGHGQIARLARVGAYALQLVWADGHDEGIYSFESLRRACPCATCTALPGAGWR